MRRYRAYMPVGRRIAGLLTGVWRDEVLPTAEIDGDLAEILRLGGVLGLAARRLPPQSGLLRDTAAATLVNQVMAEAAQARALDPVLEVLGRSGIEPVLLKGAAASALYPIRGARPSGDIDLLVPPEALDRATSALAELHYEVAGPAQIPRPFRHSTIGRVATLVGPGPIIDLTAELWPLGSADLRAALESRVHTEIRGKCVCVLPHELNIRFLAAHAAKHAFSHPMWLCDLAAAVERDDTFLWDSVLAGPRRTRSWILAALGLSANLLGLRLPPNVRERAYRTALWIEPYVLARWGGWRPLASWPRFSDALVQRSARKTGEAIDVAVPDPLEALTTLGWPIARPLKLPSVTCLIASRSLTVARSPRALLIRK